MPLDFHTFTKESSTYSYRSLNLLKTSFRRRRRLVGGPGFEKMGIASWGRDKPNPIRFHVHLGSFIVIHTRIWRASGLHGIHPRGEFPCTLLAH